MLNLYELALAIQEPLIIEIVPSEVRISFKDCEIKDCKNSTIMSSNWGTGGTIDEAADNYFIKINKKWLVFDAMGNRREYSAIIVPIPTFICSECKTPFGEGGPSEQEKV